MDRSAHVWGKYKALLTVISGYNWWVVFYCISFSWLTAFLKSPLNGKLIGWLNLHFNQSIYDRGSPRNSLAEDEATFPEGLERGSGLCSVSTHLLLLLSFVQKGLCVGGTGTPVASLSPATLGLISCRKGQMPGQGEPQSRLRVSCHWVSNPSPMGSSGGSQASSPRAPGRREWYLWRGEGQLPSWACFFYFPTGLKANWTSPKETMPETTALGPKVYLLTPIAQQLPFYT